MSTSNKDQIKGKLQVGLGNVKQAIKSEAK
jgi:uncharacterized protein YjbJ (UPF0337 family)